MFLPAYVLVELPGRWILRHKDAVPVRTFIAGVSAAAAGAIVAASVILGRSAIRDGPTFAIAVAALAVPRRRRARIERLAEPLVVVVAGVVGLVLTGV